jgi:predicted RNase H-like nuclease (RuvC/YqgF family)
MAAFTEKRTPNEFLVRWNKEGLIQGAHVGWLDTVLKDGVVLSQTETNVESVAMGLQEGFPLTDILTQLQVDCVLERETSMVEVTNLKSTLAEYKAETESLNLQIVSFQNQAQDLNNQLLKLQTTNQTLVQQDALSKNEIQLLKAEIEELKTQ